MPIVMTGQHVRYLELNNRYLTHFFPEVISICNLMRGTLTITTELYKVTHLIHQKITLPMVVPASLSLYPP